MLLDSIGAEYLAPRDAANLSELVSESFDFHLSFNVFEHIPQPSLERILIEGKRLLK